MNGFPGRMDPLRPMRRGPVALGVAAVLMALAGCSDPSTPTTDPSIDPVVDLTFDFSNDALGWQGTFADYPLGAEEHFELDLGHRPLPASLDPSRRGMFFAGMNHSDDLLAVMWRRIDGLTPDADYRATFQVTFASDAPRNCAGVGGAPGESVFVKAALVPAEPDRTIDDQGMHRLTVDIGNQGDPGRFSQVLGNVATTNPDCGNRVFEFKTLRSEAPLELSADANGGLWVLVAADSGFEGFSTLSFTRVEVRLERQGGA